MAGLFEMVVDLLGTGLGNSVSERGRSSRPPLRRTVLVQRWPLMLTLWMAAAACGLALLLYRERLAAAAGTRGVVLGVLYAGIIVIILVVSGRESQSQKAAQRGRAARRRAQKAMRNVDPIAVPNEALKLSERHASGFSPGNCI